MTDDAQQTETASPDFDALRRQTLDCLYYRAYAEGAAAARAALALRPDDATVKFCLAAHLLDLNQRAEGVEVLRRVASEAPAVTLPMASAIYLQRRQHVARGYTHEDGWITMLDVVLSAGLLPVRSFEEIAARAIMRGAGAGTSAIPSQIVQFWHNATPPDEVRTAIEATRDRNPGCAHTLFTEDDARAFVRDRLGAEAATLFDVCPHAAAKADFFRAVYLHEKGGIYLDVDEVPVRPFASYIQDNDFDLMLRFSRAEVSCIDNCFAAARPRLPLLRRIVELILGNLDSLRRNGLQTNVWVLTGPGVWSFAAIDLALDPLASYRGAPFARSCFIDGQDYHHVAASPEMAYKNDVEGNWRMLQS